MIYAQRYNRHTVVTITPPVEAAVEISELRDYLRSPTADDDMIAAFAEAATEAIKRYLRRGILTETVELRMDGFPTWGDDALLALGPGMHTAHVASVLGSGNAIDLPYGPVASVTSITTFNRANVSAVFSSANYTADLDGARVYLNEGATWPVSLRDRDAVRVRYVIGTAPGSVPRPVLHAIKQHVAVMYECRDACELPDGCKAILAGYRRHDDMGFAP